jgi:hypothetical protein
MVVDKGYDGVTRGQKRQKRSSSHLNVPTTHLDLYSWLIVIINGLHPSPFFQKKPLF